MEDKAIGGVRKELFIIAYTNPVKGGADLLMKVEATTAGSARQVARLMLYAKYGEQYKYISILDITRKTEVLTETPIDIEFSNNTY